MGDDEADAQADGSDGAPEGAWLNAREIPEASGKALTTAALLAEMRGHAERLWAKVQAEMRK